MKTRITQSRLAGLICVTSFLTFVGANILLHMTVPFHSSPPQKRLSFIEACAHEPLGTVTSLIDQGADVNQTTAKGFTPLMSAADAERLDIAALLLVRGANPHARTKFGFTALYYASANSNADVAKLLIDYGAQVNKEKRALGSAIVNDRSSIIRLLVGHGADVNETDAGTGRTNLMWAAQWTTADNVRLLLQNGAKVNARMKDDSTALMFAVWGCRPENVKVLLGAGADVKVVSQRHETALSVAEQEPSVSFDPSALESLAVLKQAAAQK
jgi:ankyrin repeat protein